MFSSYFIQAEQESEVAKEIFEVLNNQVKDELPHILDLRIPYLDPSFECMVSDSYTIKLSFPK